MYIMCNTFQINLFLQRKTTHEFSTKRLGVFEKRGQKYQKVCLTANIFMNVKSYNRIGASMHLYMKLYKYCKMYVQYTLIIILTHCDLRRINQNVIMNVKSLKQNWRKYVFVHEIVQYYKMYVQCTLTIILSNCALNAEWK